MITNVKQQGATIVCSGPIAPNHPAAPQNVMVHVQNESAVQVSHPQTEPYPKALEAPVVAFYGDGSIANVAEAVAPTPVSTQVAEVAQAAQEVPNPWTAPAETN